MENQRRVNGIFHKLEAHQWDSFLTTVYYVGKEKNDYF